MKGVILYSAVLLLAICLGGVCGEEVKEKTCKQVISDLTKRQLGGIARCTKAMKFKSGKEKAEKMNCVLKCVMINEGVLNKEGMLDKEAVAFFIDKEIPKRLQAKGKPLFDNCQETIGSQLDPKDEYCKTYDPLIKCFLTAVTNMCAGQT